MESKETVATNEMTPPPEKVATVNEVMIVVPPEEPQQFMLEPLKDLFASYVGVVVTGFITYKPDVLDLEKRIAPGKGVLKLVSDIEYDQKDLWIKLNTHNGGHGGYIKISPSINGQFVEKPSDEDPDKMARYRIKFMGEDCVEYIDADNLGQISFFNGKR